jgi:hypothetical protein
MYEDVPGKCNNDCIPACDFCLFMPHPRLPDGRDDLDHENYGSGPCENKQSPRYGERMHWGSYCKSFVCVRTKEQGDHR